MACGGTKRRVCDFRERFKPPDSLRQQYVLCCEVPQKSSYAIPLHIKNFTSPLADDGQSIMSWITDTMLAISTGDYSSATYFSDDFKKYLSYSPREFRKIKIAH